PMQYDAFYIDMCLTEGITGTEVANALIAQGVNAPIVLCCSKINYRAQSYPENGYFSGQAHQSSGTGTEY
ncbi:hypothetical protein LEA_04247, partial [human gut metagenome]